MNKRKINTRALEAVEIYDGWEQDGRAFGYNTQNIFVGITVCYAVPCILKTEEL